MFDSGHTHGPTPHFVSGCPLCDAAKAARNQAIEHLAEAIHLLAGLRADDDRPTIRLNLAPIGVTGDDAQRCHSIDLTAKLAEALADAIDSMNARAGLTETDMHLAVEDFFACEVDYQAVFDGVLEHRQVARPLALRALDEVLGEIPVPDTDGDDA